MKKTLLLLIAIMFLITSCNIGSHDESEITNESDVISDDISDDVSDDIERYYNKAKFTGEITYITELPDDHFFIYSGYGDSYRYIDESKAGDIITMEVSPGIVMTGKYFNTYNDAGPKGTYSTYKDIEDDPYKMDNNFVLDDKTGELMRFSYDKVTASDKEFRISEEEALAIVVKYMYDLTGLTGWEDRVDHCVNNNGRLNILFQHISRNGIILNSIICDIDAFGNIVYLHRNSTESLKDVPVLDVDDQIYLEGAKKCLIEEKKTYAGKTIVDIKDIKFANDHDGYLYYLKKYESNAIGYLFKVTYVCEDGSEYESYERMMLAY